jgi:hypothetical protein
MGSYTTAERGVSSRERLHRDGGLLLIALELGFVVAVLFGGSCCDYAPNEVLPSRVSIPAIRVEAMTRPFCRASLADASGWCRRQHQPDTLEREDVLRPFLASSDARVYRMRLVGCVHNVQSLGIGCVHNVQAQGNESKGGDWGGGCVHNVQAQGNESKGGDWGGGCVHNVQAQGNESWFVVDF